MIVKDIPYPTTFDRIIHVLIMASETRNTFPSCLNHTFLWYTQAIAGTNNLIVYGQLLKTYDQPLHIFASLDKIDFH